MPEAVTGVQTPDKTLVHRIRGGDRAAREELFRRHWGVAYRVAFRLLGHEQDALDAVQEALLKAITHLDDFDGRSGFRTWLLRIVNNAALDLGRRRGRRSTVSLGGGRRRRRTRGSSPTCEDDPAGGLHRQDLRRQLNAALDRLSPAVADRVRPVRRGRPELQGDRRGPGDPAGDRDEPDQRRPAETPGHARPGSAG